MKRKHCVVIGAGLAGLAGAYSLVKKGWKVTVLEADSRIGGRVFTLKLDRVRKHKGKKKPKKREPLFFELGGEWIGRDHDRMIDLCSEFKLGRLMPHQFSYSFWERGIRTKVLNPGGELPFSEKASNKFKEYGKTFRHLDDCEKQNLDQISWWSKLQELGFDEDDLDHRDLMDSTDFGESIRFTSAFVGGAEYYLGNSTDEMDMKIRDGNARLPEALAKAIERREDCHIYVQKRVKRIDQENGKVKITTEDMKESPRTPKDVVRPDVKFLAAKPRARAGARGRRTISKNEFSADACICAIPASQLKTITWKPRLPKDQGDAAAELQYARIMKTAILFPERFWRPQKRYGFSLFTNRASDFVFESSFGQRGPEAILCSYAIGDKADDLSDENPGDMATWIGDDVCDAVNVARKPAEYLHHKSWQRDECIEGAYAFYKPGQWFTVRPILCRPYKLVAFAGEHLSDAWQGFMEGAVETGEAAADSLPSLLAQAHS